jgi:hypothetical protein
MLEIDQAEPAIILMIGTYRNLESVRQAEIAESS